MHDFELLPPAVLTVCFDLQSLPDGQHLSWRDQPGRDLPLGLAERLTWGADFWNTRPRARRRAQGGLNGDRLGFADTGLDVTATHSAPDAIELLRILRFDLALIGADALGGAVPPLLRQIRLIAPWTKCIVVSATISSTRERSIREEGVLALLDSPMPLAQLHEMASLVAARGRHIAT